MDLGKQSRISFIRMETLSYLSEDMQSMVEFYCLLYSDNMYVTF